MMQEKFLDIDDPIDDWFELSYAQYLTIPRIVLESMPRDWQQKMSDLLFELDECIGWRPSEGRYWVQLRDAKGRIVHDPLMEYRHALKLECKPLVPENNP